MADSSRKSRSLRGCGKLRWEELSTGNSFIARLGSNVLEIESEFGVSASLILRNEKGRRLESISSDQLPIELGDMLVNLFEVVRRQALRVDDALDQLRNELDKL